MARALNGSQLIRDIQTRSSSRPHRSAWDSQINLPICTFKLFKTTRRRNETELNSLLARCSSTHLKRAQAQRCVSDSILIWFLFHVSLCLRYICMGGCGYVAILEYFSFKPWRRANGYHKSNVQTLRNSYDGERLNFSHTESERKKNWWSFLTLH